MTAQQKNDNLFQIVCPCCQATIWVDSRSGDVIKSEKAARKKSSLEDLLLKEKKKTEGMDHKLEATFELQKKKLQQAEEKFKDAWTHRDSED